MSSVTIAVDPAKIIVELAVANPSGHISGRRRLTRARFERFWPQHACALLQISGGSSDPFREGVSRQRLAHQLGSVREIDVR